MRTAPSFSIGVSGATNRAGGTHDANGNLLSGAGITNSYDVDNRLIATSRTGHSAGYHYSARNERIVVYEKGVEGDTLESPPVTRYFYVTRRSTSMRPDHTGAPC